MTPMTMPAMAPPEILLDEDVDDVVAAAEAMVVAAEAVEEVEEEDWMGCVSFVMLKLECVVLGLGGAGWE